jgi:endonuclease/exonuclease/phosphatase family metal-dependent hydrolase
MCLLPLLAWPAAPISSQPAMLSYDEMVRLYENEQVEPALQSKLDELLRTPIVNNDAQSAGIQPHRPVLGPSGPGLRVAFWNIERGMGLDAVKLAFSDTDAFLQRTVPGKDTDELRIQLKILQAADVVVLNEVDWGIKRTGYRAVIKELGEALGMNWAYGTEFVEIDPKLLGIEKFENVADPLQRRELLDAIAVDRSKYKGLHGTAVLSRYPIQEARLVPFRTPGYDWYAGEKKIVKFEAGKRKAAKLLGESLGREVRRGGRTNLLVTLTIPEVKEGKVTIAATHLESRADPKVRRRQMMELLELVRDVKNPVVIAGDLNTTGSKGKPRTLTITMLEKNLSTEGIVKTAVKHATGVGRIYSLSVTAYKSTRFQSDPTVTGIKPVAANPEADLFDSLEKFRFTDGTAIDFRGDPEHSLNGKSGTLANSNERGGKGFIRSFEPERNIGPKGWFKLDWIFVKAYSTDPRDESQTYRFAPHRGRTLTLLNYAPAERISDHSPITVDLPFSAK